MLFPSNIYDTINSCITTRAATHLLSYIIFVVARPKILDDISHRGLCEISALLWDPVGVANNAQQRRSREQLNWEWRMTPCLIMQGGMCLAPVVSCRGHWFGSSSAPRLVSRFLLRRGPLCCPFARATFERSRLSAPRSALKWGVESVFKLQSNDEFRKGSSTLPAPFLFQKTANTASGQLFILSYYCTTSAVTKKKANFEQIRFLEASRLIQ